MELLERLRKTMGDRRSYWYARGRRFANIESKHRESTHADRYSAEARAKRKKQRKLAKLARRRNR